MVSSYFVSSTVCIFILLLGRFLVSKQTRSFDVLNRAVPGTFNSSIGILIFGTASCFSLLFPDLLTQHFVSVTDLVTILYEVFITNVDILNCFVIKCAVLMKHMQSNFCQRFVSKWQILGLYPINLNNCGQNKMAFSHKEPDKGSLKAYYWASRTSSFPPKSNWSVWRHA